MNFYTEPLSDLLKRFDADPQKGLNEAQLEQAREKYGKNVLREQKKPSLLMRFLAQFKDTMIIILSSSPPSSPSSSPRRAERRGSSSNRR